MAGKHRFRRIAALGEIVGRRARRPVLGCTIGFADGPTGIGHLVTEDAFAEGIRTGEGYLALCGALVLPARLTAPARYHCAACERGV